jgi:hypothetical protein
MDEASTQISHSAVPTSSAQVSEMSSAVGFGAGAGAGPMNGLAEGARADEPRREVVAAAAEAAPALSSAAVGSSLHAVAAAEGGAAAASASLTEAARAARAAYKIAIALFASAAAAAVPPKLAAESSGAAEAAADKTLACIDECRDVADAARSESGVFGELSTEDLEKECDMLDRFLAQARACAKKIRNMYKDLNLAKLTVALDAEEEAHAMSEKAGEASIALQLADEAAAEEGGEDEDDEGEEENEEEEEEEEEKEEIPGLEQRERQ